MFKSKIQQPEKLSKQELALLKKLDSERYRKKKERHVANVETREFILQAQRRINYRNEYDHLVGEIGNIAKIRQTQGDRVAFMTAEAINTRQKKLQDMYKESVSKKQYAIENSINSLNIYIYIYIYIHDSYRITNKTSIR